MGKGTDGKSFTNRLQGRIRRAWSFPQARLTFCIFVGMTFFLGLLYIEGQPYASASNKYLSLYSEPIAAKLPGPEKHDIACLILAESYFHQSTKPEQEYARGVDDLFTFLRIYDRFLSPFCDVKVFVVNNSVADYEEQYMVHHINLPHSTLTFIPPNSEKHGNKRRLNTYHILAYSLKYYADYKWYLKMNDLNVLLLVDHFVKLVFDRDGNDKYDMQVPQILGQFIHDSCSDYISAKTVYAFNQEFLVKVGSIATQHIRDDEWKIDQFRGCESYKPCRHNAADDFVGFCLKDMGISLGPTRDAEGREYFLPFTIHQHYHAMDEWKDVDTDYFQGWYFQGKDPEKVGRECCAQYPVVMTNYHTSETLFLGYKRIYEAEPKQRDIAFLDSAMPFTYIPPSNGTIKYKLNSNQKK